MRRIIFFLFFLLITNCGKDDQSYGRERFEESLKEILEKNNQDSDSPSTADSNDSQNSDSSSSNDNNSDNSNQLDSDSSSTADNNDSQDSDSSSSNDNSTDNSNQLDSDSSSTADNNDSQDFDQQDTDSSLVTNNEIGFANLNFDDAISSQIAQNCEPLNVDGLYLYYSGEFNQPQKQILFKLTPESLQSLSRNAGFYTNVINSKDYFNYNLYLFYENNKLFSSRLVNISTNQSVKEIAINDETNASDLLYQMADYISDNIGNLKTNSGKESEIKDGIYKYTFATSNVNGNFICNEGISYSSMLNSNGDKLNEYFKINNRELTGYIIRDPNSQIQNEVWDLSGKLLNDADINLSVNFSSIENFNNNELIHLNDLNNPIKLVLKTNNDGNITFQTFVLEKISQLGFNAINSFQNLGFYADEIYSQIDITDPASYLDAFILDAQRHNIDLSNIDPNNFQFEIVNSNDPDVTEAVAVALKGCDDNNIKIKYIDTFWDENTREFHKKSFPPSFGVMWHEFGHDILNLQHLCLGGHIMSGRHQDPKILNNQSECNSEYITFWSMKWDHPNQDYNLERAVDDLFNSAYQIPFECN